MLHSVQQIITSHVSRRCNIIGPVCFKLAYAAKGGYSPSGQRVRILIRKMPSQKPLCSALTVCVQNIGHKQVISYHWNVSPVMFLG